MSPQLKAAAIRALYQAVGMAAVTFFTIIVQTNDWRLIVSLTALAFLGPLGFRGVGEGVIDSGRAAAGDIKPVDVGYQIAMGYQQPGQPVIGRKPSVFDKDGDGVMDP